MSSELSRRNILRGVILGAVSVPIAAQAAQSVAPQLEPILVPTMTPQERIEYHTECIKAAVEEYGGTRIRVAIKSGFAFVVWDAPSGVGVEI
ncbi:hypothetical protein GOZ89_17045 [Agrobacterium vitis]|uniref:hypothetical protein n=1 Tax=Agrobacterium vitis TaxID=373 RepID=UPI0012E71519|nr:hypothetical protein [Agrobacterium vitis]MVA81132.1 hypothetical protein [Agrobacterium vitis]